MQGKAIHLKRPGTANLLWEKNTLFVRAGAVVMLFGVLWWVYGRAMGSPLVFDDAPSVEQNPSLVRLWPLLGAGGQPGPLNPPKDLPTSGRPLVNLSLALNYHFGGLNPAGYHAFNLAVHLLAAMLLGLIV
ncbi:MAG TPA: hypothetical protein VMJ32_02120, partial [Pirellulales bacterium]|nr:hypothetical protein [Pirellulales bacterium]